MALPIARFDGQYAYLSNFYLSPVTLDGEQYPTVEHAFQAAKTIRPELRVPIQLEPDPGKAKRMGRRLSLRPDWENVKLRVVEAVAE